MRISLFAFQWSSRSLDSSPMSFFPDFVIAYHKIFVEKFSYFMMPCHQHSSCISSLFSDSVLFPPSPIPHVFQKDATRLIAYGEIEDVAHNVGGFAHGLYAVDAHRPAVVVLIEVGYAHILLQISQDAAESRRLIISRIFRRHEKHRHMPLLQHDFLNAEAAGKPAQRDHKNQLARLVGNRTETQPSGSLLFRHRSHVRRSPSSD